MNIYAIKNEKLEFFNRPVYCESFNEALSLIQNILMSDGDRALTGLRSDLALYQLGSIDFVTGKIEPCKRPVLIKPLQEIFDSIPEDKIPHTEKYFSEQIAILHQQILDLFDMVKGGASCEEKFE